jgi:glutathione S-transferase
MLLYNMPSSGNSYKVRLLLALTGRTNIALKDVEDSSDALGQAKAEGALPFGKAPVLTLEDGTQLPESNAILCYLGAGTVFDRADALARAQMLAWMFWEQNQHEGVIAVRAALRVYPSKRHLATPERMDELLTRGHALLQVMENQLAKRDWLVDDAPSLADICLYAYTHSAGPKGEFDMDRFPSICAWLNRVASLPGYVGLQA